MTISPEALFIGGVAIMILLAIGGSIFLLLQTRRTEEATDHIIESMERIELTAEKVEQLRKKILQEVNVKRQQEDQD